MSSKQNHKYYVNEIFSSIQFEGLNHGQAAVFVRFQGCNLECEFCDTKYAQASHEKENGTIIEMRALVQKILDECRSYGAELVVLTGGEPTLQPIADLVRRLSEKDRNLFFTVETNGTLIPALRDCVQAGIFVTLSPKSDELFESFKKQDAFDCIGEIKIVQGSLPKTIEKWLSSKEIATPHRFIQPQAVNGEIPKHSVDTCIEIIRRNPRVRLSIQTHKLLGLK